MSRLAKGHCREGYRSLRGYAHGSLTLTMTRSGHNQGIPRHGNKKQPTKGCILVPARVSQSEQVRNLYLKQKPVVCFSTLPGNLLIRLNLFLFNPAWPSCKCIIDRPGTHRVGELALRRLSRGDLEPAGKSFPALVIVRLIHRQPMGGPPITKV